MGFLREATEYLKGRPDAAILPLNELHDELLRPEAFTGRAGKYVKLEDTVRSFKMLVSGELDELPEQAFYMVGAVEEAIIRLYILLNLTP